MSDSKPTPSFDWLKSEMASGVKFPGTGEAATVPETDPTVSNSSVLDDLNAGNDVLPPDPPEIEELPPAVLNKSDGTTAILVGREIEAMLEFPESAQSAAVEAAPPEASEPAEPVSGPFGHESVGEQPVEESPEQESPDTETPAVAVEQSSPPVMEQPPTESPEIGASAEAKDMAAPMFAPPPAVAEPDNSEPVFSIVPTFSPKKVTAPKTPASSAPAAKDPAKSMDPAAATASSTSKEPAAVPVDSTAAPSRLPLILLASYASLVTLLLLFQLLSSRSGAKPHHLESLPDVVPEASDNLSYVPVNAPLPLGHTLTFGEKQRFGNVLVEVLRITREPIEFSHYSDPKRKRPPTQPVWKLWLRFTNVSTDQEFAPLDRNLVLRWVVKVEQQREFSNYYIVPQGADKNAETVQLFRHPPTSDWDMAGQDLGRVLKPGESFETYLPTSESGLDELPENLVWRLQIRKGLSPSGNGVTTMIEVPFRKQDIG